MMSLPSPPRMMLPVVEGGHGRPERGIEERLQTVDEGDVGERAALGAGADLAADESTASSPNRTVVVRRARQTFHDVEAREGRGARSRHRRLIEEATDRCRWSRRSASSLKSAQSKPEPPNVAVGQAGAADHDVVAAFADELVVLAVADEDVVADDRDRSPSGSKLSPGAPSDVPVSSQSSPSLPISCSLACCPG